MPRRHNRSTAWQLLRTLVDLSDSWGCSCSGKQRVWRCFFCFWRYSHPFGPCELARSSDRFLTMVGFLRLPNRFFQKQGTPANSIFLLPGFQRQRRVLAFERRALKVTFLVLSVPRVLFGPRGSPRVHFSPVAVCSREGGQAVPKTNPSGGGNAFAVGNHAATRRLVGMYKGIIMLGSLRCRIWSTHSRILLYLATQVMVEAMV